MDLLCRFTEIGQNGKWGHYFEQLSIYALKSRIWTISDAYLWHAIL